MIFHSFLVCLPGRVFVTLFHAFNQLDFLGLWTTSRTMNNYKEYSGLWETIIGHLLDWLNPYDIWDDPHWTGSTDWLDTNYGNYGASLVHKCEYSESVSTQLDVKENRAPIRRRGYAELERLADGGSEAWSFDGDSVATRTWSTRFGSSTDRVWLEGNTGLCVYTLACALDANPFQQARFRGLHTSTSWTRWPVPQNYFKPTRHSTLPLAHPHVFCLGSLSPRVLPFFITPRMCFFPSWFWKETSWAW